VIEELCDLFTLEIEIYEAEYLTEDIERAAQLKTQWLFRVIDVMTVPELINEFTVTLDKFWDSLRSANPQLHEFYGKRLIIINDKLQERM